MRKEIVIPQYTQKEFEELIVRNLQGEYSQGNITLEDMLYAPKFDRENPREWIKWSIFTDLRPHTCIIWIDSIRNGFYLVNGENCISAFNE